MGVWVDFILFDFVMVGCGSKCRVYDLFGGVSWVDMLVTGLYGVWVNGTWVIDECGLVVDCGRLGKLMCEFGC